MRQTRRPASPFAAADASAAAAAADGCPAAGDPTDDANPRRHFHSDYSALVVAGPSPAASPTPSDPY